MAQDQIFEREIPPRSNGGGTENDGTSSSIRQNSNRRRAYRIGSTNAALQPVRWWCTWLQAAAWSVASGAPMLPGREWLLAPPSRCLDGTPIVARNQMPTDTLKSGSAVEGVLCSVWAARSKGAAYDRWFFVVNRGLHGSSTLTVNRGDRCQKQLRIRMKRVHEDVSGYRLLHEAATIHDEDPVGDLAHNAEIMRDKEV